MKHIHPIGIKFKKLNDEFDTLYCLDKRHWSKSDYIVWVEVNKNCTLGCRYCHEHQDGENKWLTVQHLEAIVQDIMRLENRDIIKIHITPTLGDILLHPDRYSILDWVKGNGHVLNICSYFPKQIDLNEVTQLLDKYDSNVCLCCSLHGYTDRQRGEQFLKPHKIKDVLPILNRHGHYLNTIYIFSTLPVIGTVLFNLLFPAETMITLLALIDYENNLVLAGKPKLPYINVKYFEPNADALRIINGRAFKYVYI